VASPKNRDGQVDVSLLQGTVANASVGVGRARLVVVHPAMLQALGEDRVRLILQHLRCVGQYLVSVAEKGRDLVVGAFGVAGLVPQADGAGRLRPPVVDGVPVTPPWKVPRTNPVADPVAPQREPAK
jgi:hypothetical protein